MKVTLQPTLNVNQKNELRSWLITILTSPQLENNTETLPSVFRGHGVWIDGSYRKLYPGSWQIGEDYIYLAAASTDTDQSERLAILLCLAQLCDSSPELIEACSKAVVRYLLGEYQSLSQQLISSPVTATGIAFSSDNRVASLLEGEWLLPSGEPVDVTGWTVCATEIPPVADISVVEDVSLTGFESAFPVDERTET